VQISFQMLKFHLKKSRLNFMDGWAMSEEMLSDEPDDGDDLLATLLTDTEKPHDVRLFCVSMANRRRQQRS
jgi:hypothetical protein